MFSCVSFDTREDTTLSRSPSASAAVGDVVIVVVVVVSSMYLHFPSHD